MERYEARFYEKRDDEVVKCYLCPQSCVIPDGRTGFCRVRKNEGGILYTLNYGRTSSYGFDPIEKKPLYHFYPGRYIFSAGTLGCNFRCGFCQNWQISQEDAPTVFLSPEQVVKLAAREVEGEKGMGVAYTYSEPFMWYEFIADTAPLAREAGMKNVMVTNGYVQEEPLKELLPFIDAMNIDVKAFTNKFYRKLCSAKLDPVLRTVERALEYCHVEITTLLVPTWNDEETEIKKLVDWVASLNKDIPLHFSRYFPDYQLNLPPTPLETLRRAYEIASARLNYVYLGNTPELDRGATNCPSCGHLLIKRSSYRVETPGLERDHCEKCGQKICLT